jgi:hypothetical protein
MDRVFRPKKGPREQRPGTIFLDASALSSFASSSLAISDSSLPYDLNSPARVFVSSRAGSRRTTPGGGPVAACLAVSTLAYRLVILRFLSSVIRPADPPAPPRQIQER